MYSTKYEQRSLINSMKVLNGIELYQGYRPSFFGQVVIVGSVDEDNMVIMSSEDYAYRILSFHTQRLRYLIRIQ